MKRSSYPRSFSRNIFPKPADYRLEPTNLRGSNTTPSPARFHCRRQRRLPFRYAFRELCSLSSEAWRQVRALMRTSNGVPTKIQRTGYSHCNATQRGGKEAQRELDIQALMSTIQVIASQLRYRFTRHVEVAYVFFNANAGIPDGFRRSKSRARTSERI